MRLRSVRRSLIAGLAAGAVSFAAAACASTPAPTAGPAVSGLSPVESPPPEASTAPLPSGATQSPAVTAAPSASPAVSAAFPTTPFPSEVKDLETRLPDQVSGVTLVKYSWTGQGFLASGSNTQDVQDLLSQLGKQPADVSVAFAGDPLGGLDVNIGAFRVSGAEAGALLSAFLASIQKASPQGRFNLLNLGGKTVTQIVDPEDGSGSVYVYASGDTLFYVQSGDQVLAAAALAALP